MPVKDEMPNRFQTVDDFYDRLGNKEVESEELRIRLLAAPNATVRAEMKNKPGLALTDDFGVEAHEGVATTARLVISPCPHPLKRKCAPSLAAVASAGRTSAADGTRRLGRRPARA